MKYRVAQFVIDTQQYTVTHAGRHISVEPKVFDVIVYLIHHRSSVVSREELFAQVWAGREVSDTTLSNHIKSARKLLGDNGELQNVIKTVRGRGYQFIARVEECNGTYSADLVVAKGAETGLAASRTLWHRLTASPLVITLLLFITVAAAAVWVVSSSSTSDAASAPHSSILIVPFGVSSADEQRWQPFADQLTREVIRKLNHISALKVISASSAFQFQFQQDSSEGHIHRKLPHVRYVLNAMINVQGDANIRVTADMFDLKSNTLLWDKDFQSRIDHSNFFAIQSDIASTVSKSLEVVLRDHEQHALSALPTRNLAAYELYVSGQQQLNLLNQQSLRRSIDLFEQAIQLDPSFTLALVAKADAYRILMAYFESPARVLPQVISAVNAALLQDPQSAEALSSLGLAYVLAWRWEDAWNILNKAKSINPQQAQTELGFALYYAALGDAVAVKRSLHNANKFDPLNIEVADWGHWALTMVGDINAASDWANNQIQLHPEVGMIYSGASVSAALAMDYPRAISLASTGVALDPGSPYAYLALAQAYGYAGDTEKVKGLLQKAESLNQYLCPYESAINYIILKDHDRAFSLFDEAISLRSNCLVFSRYDQRLNPIRDDTRYQSLLTRIGLDDSSVAKYSK